VNEDVARDMSWSAQAFVKYVWPEVASWCGGGELKPVESVSARGFVRDLDVLAGIDAWQLLRDRGYMRGVASRMQVKEKSYETFTIRTRRYGDTVTEFEKRVTAIRDREAGALYPALTVQGYVADRRDGPLVGAGMVRTGDLLTAFEGLRSGGKVRPKYVHDRGCDKQGAYPRPPLGAGCVQGCAEFCPIKWTDLQAAGYQCRVWSPR
jgi:hypothetical protein